VSALDKISTAVTSQKEKKDKGGPGAWWRWPLIIILVLIGIAVAAWALGRNRRELAKLRHEKNKREILAENAKVLSEVEGEEKSAEMRLQAANESLERVAEINTRIQAAKDRYEKDKDRASRITWADLPAG
jgi:uncharacterized protein HemX